MKITEHPLWDTMNNLNSIKEYLKENLIEELPNSFWELLDESILEVSEMLNQRQMQGKENFIHIPLQQIEQWTKDEGITTEEMINRLEEQLNTND